MKIYYAHPMSWYGTNREALDIHALSQHGEVINPNTPKFEDRVRKAQRSGYPVMQIFADYIRDEADVVAFRAYDDHKIGAGVARELLEAIVWAKPIWQIFGKASQPTAPFINKELTYEHGIYPADITLSDFLTKEQTTARRNTM